MCLCETIIKLIDLFAKTFVFTQLYRVCAQSRRSAHKIRDDLVPFWSRFNINHFSLHIFFLLFCVIQIRLKHDKQKFAFVNCFEIITSCKKLTTSMTAYDRNPQRMIGQTIDLFIIVQHLIKKDAAECY